MRRLAMPLLLTICSVVLAVTVLAQSPAQAQLTFVTPDSDAQNAGIWVDGQYVGYAKEFTGDHKLVLLPGTHEIVARQVWYKDFVQQVTLEPGTVQAVTLTLEKDTRTPPPDMNAELRIVATPSRAAVFVDGQFAGHVNEFNGLGRAMLLAPGTHKIQIALPGYVPFETAVDLSPHQKLKIETTLQKGSITESGGMVNDKSDK